MSAKEIISEEKRDDKSDANPRRSVLAYNAYGMAAFSNIVPGAVLHLDARNNPNHPDAWTSIAEAGGHVPPMDAPPALEEGPIKIPDIGN